MTETAPEFDGTTDASETTRDISIDDKRFHQIAVAAGSIDLGESC